MTQAKTKFLSIMLLAGVCMFAYALISILDESSSHPSLANAQPGTLERWQAQQEDAERRVRKDWEFSDYSKSAMPAEMASGKWSSTTNILDCNTERFECAEVDFKIPAHNIKAVWIASYEKGTLDYFATRTVTDATTTLFSAAPPSQEEVKQFAQRLSQAKANDR